MEHFAVLQVRALIASSIVYEIDARRRRCVRKLSISENAADHRDERLIDDYLPCGADSPLLVGPFHDLPNSSVCPSSRLFDEAWSFTFDLQDCDQDCIIFERTSVSLDDDSDTVSSPLSSVPRRADSTATEVTTVTRELKPCRMGRRRNK